jgi:hypothetical protein
VILELCIVRADEGLVILEAEMGRVLPIHAKEDAKETLAKRQANAALALLRRNQAAKVWPLLKHSPDPRLRSYLIHRLGPLGADVRAVVKQLHEEPDVTIQRALILSLGAFANEVLPAADWHVLEAEMKVVYKTAEDPGLHAAAEWLLRHRGQETWLRQINDAWASDKEQKEKRLARIAETLTQEKEKAKPQWYINGQGQTMVVIPGPLEFAMGSPPEEAARRSDIESQHRKRIGRSFALAAKPVTGRQYQRFWEGYRFKTTNRLTPHEDCPALAIDWYAAAAYCNWLSKEEGIEMNQWCYQTDSQGQVTQIKEKYLALSGYRLPTEAEWEAGCRAGAVTSRFYGESDALLGQYGWFSGNSAGHTRPVGTTKPNDLGIFDVHGNVQNWCQEGFQNYPQRGEGMVFDDIEEDTLVIDGRDRVLRGGQFVNHPPLVRSAHRFPVTPAYRDVVVGIRPARTVPAK